MFEIKPLADAISIRSNGLPVGQPTGIFPIAKTDPVYRYDTNPNAIAELPLAFEITRTSVRAAQPSCLAMGMIGFSTTGVALYNALDDAGRDAAGQLLTNIDLDACHGRAETVDVDGCRYDDAYRLAREYPYIMGCFSGAVAGYAALDPGVDVAAKAEAAGRPEALADIARTAGELRSMITRPLLNDVLAMAVHTRSKVSWDQGWQGAGLANPAAAGGSKPVTPSHAPSQGRRLRAWLAQ